MKIHVLILLTVFLFLSSVHAGHRRILHHPLFPDASSYPNPYPYPPPDNDLLSPPPPDSSDQPFFPEDSNVGIQTPPPSTPSANGSGPIPTATKPIKPTNRAAVAILVGLVSFGVLLSALLFLVVRKRTKKTKKKPVEDRKLEGFNPLFQSNGDGSIAHPSSYLYIGTVDPTTRSPSSIEKPLLPENLPTNTALLSSPDVIKHAIVPSIEKTPPTHQLPSLQPLPRENRRPKFRPPPPPPNLALLQSLSNQQHVNEPPKVRSTWTSFIKPPSESTLEASFMQDLDSGRGSSGRPNGDNMEETKPKLKPLHWDKVKATSDRVTAWDQLEPSSFRLNEDMMESLFGCNSNNSNKLVKNETSRRSVEKENRVLDPKKSQNVAILLRALNVTRDEVSEALLDGNSKALGAELLETLVKMAPTKEEEIKLTGYKGDTSNLNPAEKFLKAILDIPFAFRRVEAMLYRANFDTEVKYLKKSFETLEEASSELKNSRMFLKLLEAVLTTGNRMNVGTNRGGAKAFRLDTLLKLVDIKGADGKTTLLHFVVQEIIRTECNLGNQTNTKDKDEEFRRQGLIVVTRLSREIGNVKLAAGMDSDVLHSNVSKLETGLSKLKTVLQYERPDMEGKFFESMKAFVNKADEEICRIKGIERKSLNLVREVTEYFHGDAVKEESHPLRIFMIVRDFISTLDHVCKDVGTTRDRTVISEERSFRINVQLPVLSRYNARRYDSSSEESSSP